MHYLLVLPFAFLALADSAGATNAEFMARFVPTWSATCAFPSGEKSLVFASTSGDPTEDDMALSIGRSSAKGLALPVPRALYVADSFQSQGRSLCDRVAAFAMPSGNILLLLIRDDRPSEDRAIALLLNPDANAVIDGPKDLGSFWQKLNIARRLDGVSVKLIHYTKGQESESAPIFTKWARVTEQRESIVVAWEGQK